LNSELFIVFARGTSFAAAWRAFYLKGLVRLKFYLCFLK